MEPKYQLPLDQKIDMVQQNIEAQARKVYAERLTLEMAKATNQNSVRVLNIENNISLYLNAQLALEKIKDELESSREVE